MDRIAKSRLFWFILLVLLALIAPVFIKNEYHIHILITVFLNILIASGLGLTMTTGLVPFSQAAFVAIGGYASALSVMKFGLSSWVGLIFAFLVTMVIAITFGSVLLRLGGAYFFMATAAFGEIVLLVFTRFTYPFGGGRWVD